MQGQQDSPWQGKSWHGAAPFRKVHPCSSPGLVLWHQEPNFQELLAAWESLGCLHVEPFKEFVLPS